MGDRPDDNWASSLDGTKPICHVLDSILTNCFQLYPFIKASELDLSDDKSDVVVSLIQEYCSASLHIIVHPAFSTHGNVLAVQ